MKIGFYGCGNMGGALCRAVSRGMPSATLLLCDLDEAKMAELSAETGAISVKIEELLAESDYVFLGLKPQILPMMLKILGGEIARSHATYISMAAGVTIGTLTELLREKPVIRIMPNTAVAVGAGMTVYTPSEGVTEKAKADFLRMMSASGRCDEIHEPLMDAACALSGCGPAFAYLFAEALADGAVACGLPRDRAMTYAAATVEGAMRMILETGKHPGALKDAVCSPGGSTIAGVHALEQGGLRAAAMDAVVAAFLRTKELGKS